MYKILMITALTLGLSASTVEARPTVVVFDIEDQTRRLKRADLRTLHQLLAGKLVERQRVQVVPHGVLRATLAKKRRWRCVDWKCQKMVALDLKANYVMATKILRLGSKCLVMGSIYNMKTSLLQRSASIKAGCSLDALVAVMERLPARLAPGKLRITRVKSPRAKTPRAKAPARKAPARRVWVRKKPARKKPLRKKKPARVAKVRKKPAPAVKKASTRADFDEPGIGTARKVPKARPAKPARSAAVAVKEPPRRRRAMPMWPAIAAAGVGVVGLSVGIPLAALDGTGHGCTGPDEPDYANCEQLWDTGTVGWIFTGLGIGALATSGVLFYFHYFGKKERQTASLPSLTITPTANGGLYVGAGGRF